MTGILDLDVVCMAKVFKFLNPLDLCSLKQTCTKLRESVDDDFHSLHYVRKRWLDLTTTNAPNVNKILKNFGRFVLRLEVGRMVKPNIMLDVIATNCHGRLKGLSWNDVPFNEIDMERFAEIFNNLEIVELNNLHGDRRCIQHLLLGHKYPNLTTLRIKNSDDYRSEIVRQFFMRKRNIKELCCDYIAGDVLPLIALHGAEIEKLVISLSRNTRNMMLLLAKLKKLKWLEIVCGFEQEPMIQIIEQLLTNTELETLGLISLKYTDELCNALSTLTNLKKLQLSGTGTESLEMLGRKLTKLETLTLMDCSYFPYRKFLASACKSDKYARMNIWAHEREHSNFYEQIVKDFTEGRRKRSFVLGKPLCIYLEDEIFDDMKEFLTQDNLQLIEKYGNMKILRTTYSVFFN